MEFLDRIQTFGPGCLTADGNAPPVYFSSKKEDKLAWMAQHRILGNFGAKRGLTKMLYVWSINQILARTCSPRTMSWKSYFCTFEFLEVGFVTTLLNIPLHSIRGCYLKREDLHTVLKSSQPFWCHLVEYVVQ